MIPVPLQDVQLTEGFWAERQAVNREVSMRDLWERANNSATGHVIQNFEIAAGRRTGKFEGTFWHDAWLYKWLETASYVLMNDPDAEFEGRRLDARVDGLVALIAEAQEDDGYLATQVSTVEQFSRFEQMKRHELYTMGHMITAACAHHRATGRTNFLDIAVRCADYVADYFAANEARHPDFPNNPSIIMAAVDLYRVTGNKAYLDMASRFIDMRGKYAPEPQWKTMTEEEIRAQPFHLQAWNNSQGTINNQNYVPLRESKEVLGHAVFFTYLYAGAADAYLETGDKTLWDALERHWHDLVEKKMYVTGGVSPHHMSLPSFSFHEGQREYLKADFVNEGVARPYDLPNAHGYNETCGMVGNMMWNWRMLQASGEACYADIMELNWFNSILSGVELDGIGWSYANPLRWHAEDHEVIHKTKYARKRGVPGRKLICCPTNILRSLAAYARYLYGTSEDTLWLNHYAGSEITTELPGGAEVKLMQETAYPWDGSVKLTLQCGGEFALRLRIPYWADGATLTVNGRAVECAAAGGYSEVSRRWKSGDTVELHLPMEVKILVSDYLMETTRGQAAIKRGPVVYCLESNDLPEGVQIEQVQIPSDAAWESEFRPGVLGGVAVLKTRAEVARAGGGRIGAYQELVRTAREQVDIELIPYFAWNNRREAEMSVWLPLNIR
jgi:DUF1680 family protein